MNLTRDQKLQIRKRFAELLRITVSQIILCGFRFSRRVKGCGLEWWVVTCKVKNGTDEKPHGLYVGILPSGDLEFVAIGIYEEAAA